MKWVALMYHNITAEPIGVSGGPEHFSVPASAFGTHLDEIRAIGCDGVSVEEAIRREGRDVVAISFDDGEIGQYEHAVPALTDRGMTATFFITTAWVGTPGFVTWEHLREMRAAGMSIQSHTRSHPFLSELERGRLEEELRGAKDEIDTALGQETTSLAFPGGDPPRRRLRWMLKSAGYRIVATSRWGTNPPLDDAAGRRHWVRRCTMRGAPPLSHVRRIISGDPRLSARRWVRETMLGNLRSSLGPTRYARWRRRFLNLAGGR